MKYILLVIIFVISFASGWFLRELLFKKPDITSPIETIKELQRPLDKYNFDNLIIADIVPGTIVVADNISDADEYTSYTFSFSFSPSLDKSIVKKSSGQINIPKEEVANIKLAIIVMFRGYVDQTLYTTGDGTRRAAEVFAKNGYITIAPDFLGYGDSDPVADNIYETRFQTYVTALSLIKSLENFPNDTSLVSGPAQLTDQLITRSAIFLWGHSNGGQIAVTVLELTGKAYPTSLWAPVTKPFPYSVLYYTDQSEDGGKLIRKELADFEAIYDVQKYSLANYLDRIKAPMVLHQGSADDSVPIEWSDGFERSLRKYGQSIEYNIYPDTDHNMRPSWDSVVTRDVEFYNSHLK